MKYDQVTEQIRERIDIVDFISRYVDLKRAGQNFKGLCPFHSEKTPSFMVSPVKQIFHCYGCHKGGDIFTFIMEHEGISFPDALAMLAQEAGVTIQQNREKGQRSEKETLLEIYRETAAFFRKQLALSRKACAYLQERELTPEIIERFEIGYSCNDRQALYDFLKNARYTDSQMRAAGLVYFGDAGHFDFFRDRIMFPIHDAQGKVIAFGGRTLGQGQNLPKYINSSESIIFKKSETVYGLHLAKRTIAEKGYALITEGYLDTIVCHQFGFQNTIAPLGTALTAGHLKKIRRFTDKVVFVFDGDSAGIAAARRSLDLAFAEGFMVKIAVLPKGEDPDTFLRTHGESAMRRILGAALSPVRFLLRLHARNKLDGVRAALKLLVTCPDGLIRDEAIRELSDSARISEAILRDEMKGIMRTSFKTAHGLSRAVTGTSSSALHAATKNPEEEVLLAVALAVPEQCRKILDRLEIDSIEDATIRKIITKMATFISHGSTATDVQKLLVESSPDERSLMTRLMMIYPVDQEYADRTVKDCLHRIALRTITKKIQEAEAIQDTRLVAALIAEKSRLVRAEKRED